MASIKENKNVWAEYIWPKQGDEWSEEWGGTPYLWHGTILPRILSKLPVDTIFEIAPGFGRCTSYLQYLCKKIIIVDVAEKCINYCKKRFKTNKNIEYYVNDGKSLEMLKDKSIDFVFSWDSMVHVESNVIEEYLKQLSKRLKPGAYGFIHHSNIGVYKKEDKLTIENPHWRADSMKAELFREYCRKYNMKCVTQEIINWNGKYYTDCFSLFVNKNISNNTIICENDKFGDEINNMKKISDLYNNKSK